MFRFISFNAFILLLVHTPERVEKVINLISDRHLSQNGRRSSILVKSSTLNILFRIFVYYKPDVHEPWGHVKQEVHTIYEGSEFMLTCIASARYILALAGLDLFLIVHRGYPWTGIPRMTRLHPLFLIIHRGMIPEILRTYRLDPGYSSSCIEVRSLDFLGLVERGFGILHNTSVMPLFLVVQTLIPPRAEIRLVVYLRGSTLIPRRA